MQKRYMDRSNSMGRGKRGLDFDPAEGEDDGQPDRKRPALASVIVEALKVDSLQKLCSSLEPILRRVVSEEVERALARLGPCKLSMRCTTKHIEGPDGRNLQLQFRSRLSLPLFTGGKVEGEDGAPIHAVLINGRTGRVVTTGPESVARLDVVVLEGDFNEDTDDWTREDFDSHLVRERDGKRPLLTGDLQVMLKDGVGTLGELTFTDNSSWIRSRKFRLGLKVAPGCCEDVRIREAKTDAFTVKDHRGELYKKHYPPSLSDEVWRLEKIGKDGSFHKRLNKAGIFTVEDFLRLVARDAQQLRTILGSGMSNKMWDVLIEHAKTCILSGKIYVYHPEDASGVGVVLNNIYEFSGLIAEGQFIPTDSLSDSQKIYVDALVKKAYENWMHVTEYDGKSLMDLTQDKGPGTSLSNVTEPHQDYAGVLHHQQLPVASLPASSIPGDQAGVGFPMLPQNINTAHSFQFDPSSFPLQGPASPTAPKTELTRSDDLVSFNPQQSTTQSGFEGPSNFNSFGAPGEVYAEEDIRLRSREMLENDDMVHFLRALGVGGGDQSQPSYDLGIDNYPLPHGYNDMYSNAGALNTSSHSSGKAVVGWLKLKAALRWGIFVRKKAAERRAQLVELDDMHPPE